ncbi:UDP-N-acetylglucosamine 2-epimerase (non-hydrolyzing) [Streptomyces anulatus]|uniref:non-hydrolyzing UDP-N-acetylglucosamine 2-epimerase n=1 Tax=Streptomyces anulatus TaxID=1892 RepID=UPI001C5D0A59|nr:UDP-N-acetylglucosamine 2-epimerase (non-hydrolyzing) [Streptomyces anulatus]QYA98435.1 UDP-N-acetylglucosamine 2-epimerase (non-hydrolyzing) [Streptomyces anulatus]
MTFSADRTVAVVLGTRPELVKLAELIRLLGPAARVVHTGQHYDDALSGAFLDELGLPEPEYLTGVGGQPRAVQVATALAALDERFAAEPPLAVVVQGDTNAALSGALVANARSIPLVHVEAGLRSHDRAMPEEHNRVVIDRLADALCAATSQNRALLLAEGVSDERIAVTGNTVVEAVRDNLPPRQERAQLLSGLGLEADGYVLATVHRPENTDDPAVLAAVLGELAAIGRTLRVVLPLHPRTRARIEAAGLCSLLDGVTPIEPTAYGTFLALARHAALLVSDSGGVQEETTVLGRPLVVVRRSTERPEAFADFADLVEPGPGIGVAVRRRLAEGPQGLRRLAALPSPYGDGTASRRIAELIDQMTGRDAPRAAVPGPLVAA